MSRRTREDKKRQKRVQAAKERKEHNKEASVAFFKICDGFPLDIKQEILRVIKKHPYTNKKWKSLSSNISACLPLLDDMLRMSANPEAFAKYFPRLAIDWVIKNNKCIIWPYKTKRVFIDGQVYYDLPKDIRLPLCGGHKIVFTKHAIERVVHRYTDKSLSKILTPPSISFYYPMIVLDMRNVDYEIAYINDEPHLHSFGHYNHDQDDYFARGHFPLRYEGKYAIAKTFLYDEWLKSSVVN